MLLTHRHMRDIHSNIKRGPARKSGKDIKQHNPLRNIGSNPEQTGCDAATNTDILGYIDTLGTREKCHCKQIFAYSDTFW